MEKFRVITDNSIGKFKTYLDRILITISSQGGCDMGFPRSMVASRGRGVPLGGAVFTSNSFDGLDVEDTGNGDKFGDPEEWDHVPIMEENPLPIREIWPESLMSNVGGKCGNALKISQSKSHEELRWLRQQMGLVSQEPVLFNDTFRANIAYGKEEPATEAEILAASELANAHEFISGLQQVGSLSVSLP
ncbi:hypothetical protein GIB67_004275 [Kingdonia uniflora]|uniref:Uncharacterized protein n=1 Tax=Kingdonia uniflora TaxID=39325 RepID=A0A7J7MR95_9MAGN|nr:hypothetical protein GIB67_004275 [Kingdonia uniflora]